MSELEMSQNTQDTKPEAESQERIPEAVTCGESIEKSSESENLSESNKRSNLRGRWRRSSHQRQEAAAEKNCCACEVNACEMASESTEPEQEPVAQTEGNREHNRIGLSIAPQGDRGQPRRERRERPMRDNRDSRDNREGNPDRERNRRYDADRKHGDQPTRSYGLPKVFRLDNNVVMEERVSLWNKIKKLFAFCFGCKPATQESKSSDERRNDRWNDRRDPRQHRRHHSYNNRRRPRNGMSRENEQ